MTNEKKALMGKEREGTTMNNGTTENISVPPPPGFTSHTCLRLKRMRDKEETENSKDYFDVKKLLTDTMSGLSDVGKLKRCLSHSPWMLSGAANHKSEEFESKRFDKGKPSETCLPKGVIRGCPDCSFCVKVTARWRPEDARTDVFGEAPIFYPTEEEFKDTLKYIAKICPSAERHGICRIVPPPSWNPQCVLKEKHILESSTFVTQVQRIDGLQVPYSQSKTASYVEDMQGKRRMTLGIGLDCANGNGHAELHRETGCYDGDQHFESVCGPEFTAETFKRYADDFKGQYFCKSKVTDSNGSSTVTKEQWEPSLEDIEGEYKRIVDNPTEEIEVLCCNNLDAGVFGSGFPTASNPLAASSDPEILNSGWNLNNVPTLPGSLLSSETCETSHLVPRVRIGMCFSTLHWRVEEHHLYSLCYLHLGAPKIWYGIPGAYNHKVQMALNYLSADHEAQHDLHHKMVKQLSPSALNSEGIPIFRCIQNPREFVLVFPQAYHSGFDCGFNCSETANLAPFDWLPHGQNAVELYRELGRKTYLSYDKLLLRAAFEALRSLWEVSFKRKTSKSDNQLWVDACGKKGFLTRALKLRVKGEDITRKYLCNSLQIRRMDEKFDATDKRECKICLYDLHFSAAGCPCSTEMYSCLNHAKQLCSCAWSEKFFLFRHDISELNLLVEALEGKLSSIFKLAKEKLGLTFNSHYASQKSSEESRQEDSPTSHLDKLEQKKSQNVAKPTSSSSSASKIREEIKARQLQSTISKKSKENATTSIHAARPSNSEETKSRLLQPSVSRKSQAKDNATKTLNGATPAGINGVADSTISKKTEEKGKAAPAVISSIGKDYSFLQVEAASGLSSGSSSETSSEESDEELSFRTSWTL